jgi:hypothetical protein
MKNPYLDWTEDTRAIENGFEDKDGKPTHSLIGVKLCAVAKLLVEMDKVYTKDERKDLLKSFMKFAKKTTGKDLVFLNFDRKPISFFVKLFDDWQVSLKQE